MYICISQHEICTLKHDKAIVYNAFKYIWKYIQKKEGREGRFLIFFVFFNLFFTSSCDSFIILLMQLQITKLSHSLNSFLLRNQLLLYHSPQYLLFQMIKTFEMSPREKTSWPHCPSIPAALTPSWLVDIWMHIWLQVNPPSSSSQQEGSQHTAARVGVTCGHGVTQQILTETNMSNGLKQTIGSKEVISSSICNNSIMYIWTKNEQTDFTCYFPSVALKFQILLPSVSLCCHWYIYINFQTEDS